MSDLAASLEAAHALDIEELAASIQQVGFSCTQCGECCRAEPDTQHTATIHPDEVRDIQAETDLPWRDVARPIPFGLDEHGRGETFEWALQTDGCGDCVFLESDADGTTACGIYGDHPSICRTYPFQVDLAGTTAPQSSLEMSDGQLLVYECEGVGEPIDRARALKLAEELKMRTIKDIQEAMALLAEYEPADSADGIVVHDAEGAKQPDGEPVDPP